VAGAGRRLLGGQHRQATGGDPPSPPDKLAQVPDARDRAASDL
jgi:hypothetical protein